MEVHPPHHPVHGWRDFAIHLIIVTIGLCIALFMEALVEHIHHRHLVREARETIRRELEINHKLAQSDIVALDREVAQQHANIISIHGLMSQGAKFHGSVTNFFDIEDFNEGAWRTARDTGALSYMPYDEVQRYSDLYSLQEFIDSQSAGNANRMFEAAAPFKMGYPAEALPKDVYASLLRDNSALEVLLTSSRQLLQQYDDRVAAELKDH